MSQIPTRRAVLFTSFGAATLALMGCDSKKEEAFNTPPPAYEGQYKNAKGEVVLELKNSMATYVDPQSGQKTESSFSEVEGGKLMVESSTGTFTMAFQPPDTITGLPLSIARGAEPVKKGG